MKYFSKTLLPEISKKLPGKKLKDHKVVSVNELNGFMSAIYKAEIITENSDGYLFFKLHFSN